MLSSELRGGATAEATLHKLNPADERAWDEFVVRTGATFFHQTGWKRVVEKTFGYQPCYRFAKRGEQITAIAPMFRVSNWVIGDCLISTPMAVYGGISTTDEASGDQLRASLTRYATEQGVQHLELRQAAGEIRSGFHHNSLYVTFGKKLLPDHDANMKDLPRDTRYMIRKASKNGLVARHGLDQLDAFYRLFSISMHRHGTPVFPRSLFNHLAAEFPENVDLMVVYAGEEAVTGVFSFIYRDAILPYYAGAGPNATALAANNFMYWELMKWAVERELRWFDFGRSKKGTGSYQFKTQWNMQMETLAYQLFLVRRNEVPNFSPINPKFELATKVWQKLPLSLATWAGPQVVKWFP
jgi:FemAB-related protein (PEP-CTERM system-associated)